MGMMGGGAGRPLLRYDGRLACPREADLEGANERDVQAYRMIEQYVASRRPIILRIFGQRVPIIATIDCVVTVYARGVKRLLVHATNARTRVRFRIYTASVLAAKPFLGEEDEQGVEVDEDVAATFNSIGNRITDGNEGDEDA